MRSFLVSCVPGLKHYVDWTKSFQQNRKKLFISCNQIYFQGTSKKNPSLAGYRWPCTFTFGNQSTWVEDFIGYNIPPQQYPDQWHTIWVLLGYWFGPIWCVNKRCGWLPPRTQTYVNPVHQIPLRWPLNQCTASRDVCFSDVWTMMTGPPTWLISIPLVMVNC